MSPRHRTQHIPGEPYTSWQAAVHLGMSKRWVTQEAARGRFLGAVLDGRGWSLTADSVASEAGRWASASQSGLSVAQAAGLLNLAPVTVARWCRLGVLPGSAVDRGRWLIPEDAVEAAVDARNAPDNHAVTYMDLERVGRGLYRLKVSI